MSGRFFTFQLSGYETYLAENIAASARVLQNHAAVVDGGVRVVCAGGASDGDNSVVVDRLLLVLLHPYYRDILQNRDTTSIILPDVTLEQLSEDFFGVLVELCGNFVNSPENIKEKVELKSEIIDIDDNDDNIENVDYNEGAIDFEEHEEDLPEILSIDFEDNEKKQFEERSKHVKVESTLSPVKGTKRGQKTCPRCEKKYNNRSIPYRCECDHILGGNFVSHEQKPRMLKCPECEYQVCQRNAKSALKKHHDAIHANVTYSCDFCDYKSGYKQVLKKHVQSLHKGALYYCKECDYKNKFESGLFQHVQAVHRGVRYMCQFCGHQAIQTSALRKHEKAKHKEELEKLGNIKKSRARFQVYPDATLL